MRMKLLCRLLISVKLEGPRIWFVSIISRLVQVTARRTNAVQAHADIRIFRIDIDADFSTR